MTCDHSGAHSGLTRYSRHTRQLRLVLVCDRCGAERCQLGELDYSPNPSGTPAQTGADAGSGAGGGER
jgi:hypothetical protein